MTIAIDGKWIWDSWYAHDGEQYHGFFLQADTSLGDPDLRHFNVSQGHAVSKDLKNWTHLGTTFAPSTEKAWDDYTTWTGSVVRGDDNLWHLFYTGTSRAESGMYQRIGHATSTDLHNWTRVGNGLCLGMQGEAAGQYEAEMAVGHWHDRAMRDPWVMRNPKGEGWVMYFTGRVPGREEPNEGGAVGFATSPDLMTWTLQGPIFAGAFGQLEVPQVFEVDGKWYCLFCTASNHWSEAYKKASGETPVTGTHYLIADDPAGPWSVAPGPFLDGSEPCRRYAARIVHTEDGLRIMGFSHNTKEDFGGYVMDPEAVVVEPNGLLRVIQNTTGE